MRRPIWQRRPESRPGKGLTALSEGRAPRGGPVSKPPWNLASKRPLWVQCKIPYRPSSFRSFQQNSRLVSGLFWNVRAIPCVTGRGTGLELEPKVDLFSKSSHLFSKSSPPWSATRAQPGNVMPCRLAADTVVVVAAPGGGDGGGRRPSAGTECSWACQSKWDSNSVSKSREPPPPAPASRGSLCSVRSPPNLQKSKKPTKSRLKADREGQGNFRGGLCHMGRLKKVPSGSEQNYLPPESSAEPLAPPAGERSNTLVL